MSNETSKYLKFGGATVVILMMLGYLAYTGVQEARATTSPLKNYADWATVPTRSGLGLRATYSRDRSSGMARMWNLFWWSRI